MSRVSGGGSSHAQRRAGEHTEGKGSDPPRSPECPWGCARGQAERPVDDSSGAGKPMCRNVTFFRVRAFMLTNEIEL